MSTSYKRIGVTALIAVLAAAGSGCGKTVREGRSPVMLVVNNMQAASGAEPDELGGVLFSDVTTLVKADSGDYFTIYADNPAASLSLAMKDIGPPGNPTSPSSNNSVTISRYRVEFTRTDGRNTPGVDVPYAFEGASTVTVFGDGVSTVNFTIVRHQAKSEAPLKALAGGGSAQFISTIAHVTFYGRDAVGNEVVATGQMSVNFGDWADPQ